MNKVKFMGDNDYRIFYTDIVDGKAITDDIVIRSYSKQMAVFNLGIHIGQGGIDSTHLKVIMVFKINFKVK